MRLDAEKEAERLRLEAEPQKAEAEAKKAEAAAQKYTVATIGARTLSLRYWYPLE